MHMFRAKKLCFARNTTIFFIVWCSTSAVDEIVALLRTDMALAGHVQIYISSMRTVVFEEILMNGLWYVETRF